MEETKEKLFEQRDNLAESVNIRRTEINELREEFEKSIGQKKRHLNELIILLEDVRTKLYRLGVLAEDC